MEIHKIELHNHTFIIHDYGGESDVEIYFEENNTLYDEGNGFPDISVVDDYLYVQANYKEMIYDEY